MTGSEWLDCYKKWGCMITLLIVSLVVYLVGLAKRKRDKKAAEGANMEAQVPTARSPE